MRDLDIDVRRDGWRGRPIPGEDFHRALLRIWLGERPADVGLKKGMLGQAS